MKKYFLLLLLFVSCKSRSVPEEVFGDFAVRVELSSPETVIGDLVNPKHLAVSDSFVLFKEDTDSTTVALYDTSGNHITNFLWKGRGPGETTNTLDVSFYNDKVIQAFVYLESIYLYEIEKLLAGDGMPYMTYALSQGDYASSTMIQCGLDSLFYIGKNPEAEVNNTRFCLRDMRNDVLSVFGEYPKKDDKIAEVPEDDYSRPTAYQGRPLLKPDHTKIVVPYYYAVGFDVVDVKNQSVEYSKFYQYPGVECKYIPQIKATVVKSDEEKYRGFLDVCCSDNSVYFLFSSKKLGDPSCSEGRYVLKYSWEGKPECCYVLDSEVAYIAIDRDEKYLYVCRHDINGSTIDRYSL